MNVLLPMDGSLCALSAARFLSRHLRPDGPVRVDLTTVVPPPTSRTGGLPTKTGPYPAPWWETGSALPAAEEQALEAAGFDATRRFVAGRPEEVLVGMSENYDLVVVGATGRDASSPSSIGGVARALLRHARSSVLLVRGNEPDAARVCRADAPTAVEPFRILVATDGDGEEVLASWPVVWPFATGDSAVEVLTVVEPRSTRVRPASNGGEAPSGRNGIGSPFDALPRVVRSGFKRTVREGRPGAEIERQARESQAHLVVLGLGAGGPTGPAPLGSTAREVAWRSPCSILMIRPPQGAASSHPARGRSALRRIAS